MNSVQVVIKNVNGKILLIKSPLRGWEMPGGLIERNEKISDAAIREVYEETGLIIKTQKFCGVFQNLQKEITIFLFFYLTDETNLIGSPESVDPSFFTMKEVKELVTFPTFLKRIEMCLDTTTHPFLIEF